MSGDFFKSWTWAISRVVGYGVLSLLLVFVLSIVLVACNALFFT